MKIIIFIFLFVSVISAQFRMGSFGNDRNEHNYLPLNKKFESNTHMTAHGGRKEHYIDLQTEARYKISTNPDIHVQSTIDIHHDRRGTKINKAVVGVTYENEKNVKASASVDNKGNVQANVVIPF